MTPASGRSSRVCPRTLTTTVRIKKLSATSSELHETIVRRRIKTQVQITDCGISRGGPHIAFVHEAIVVGSGESRKDLLILNSKSIAAQLAA